MGSSRSAVRQDGSAIETHELEDSILEVTKGPGGQIARVCLDLPEVFDALLEALGGGCPQTEFVITAGGRQEEINVVSCETNVGNNGEIMFGESRLQLLP